MSIFFSNFVPDLGNPSILDLGSKSKMCVRQTKSSDRSAPQGLILPTTGYAPKSLLSDNSQEVVIET